MFSIAAKSLDLRGGDMKRWTEDKRWAARFIPEMASIIGSLFVREPPIEEDQSHNTDLSLVNGNDGFIVL